MDSIDKLLNEYEDALDARDKMISELRYRLSQYEKPAASVLIDGEEFEIPCLLRKQAE